jgi:hypothetical protein
MGSLSEFFRKQSFRRKFLSNFFQKVGGCGQRPRFKKSWRVWASARGFKEAGGVMVKILLRRP